MSILVGAESRDGAARDIAESIAHALTQRGFEVTLGDAADLERAKEFDAIVFGSDVRAGHWSDAARAGGATALEKPSFAASFSRACACATGRIAPDRPSSPK